jgi:hypothetical protein
MSLILSGTNGLSDVDGTAATPAIRGTDANTGVFFPAADTIAFAEGGVEAMRLDASGNVGIGTSSPTGRLNVSASDTGNAIGSGAATLNITNSNEAAFGRTTNLTFSSGTGVAANTIAAITGIYTSFSSSRAGALAFSTDNGSGSFSEKMRLDSSGNLLVGTTSAPANRGALIVRRSTTATTIGNFFNDSTDPYGVLVQYSAAAPNDTTHSFFYGADSGANRFFVYSNGGIANFSGNNVNLSDRREKTNFAPAKSYLDTICSIPVQTFNYADQNNEQDPGLTLGVVAQDVQAVAPELVMESNWGTKENPKMRLSIYQTDLQYALMKSIQELKAELDTVKAELAAMKGTA